MLKLPQMRLRAGTATGGAAMSNSVRNYVWLVVGALVCIAGVLVFHFAPKALRWGRAGVIVRRPNPKPLTKASDRQLRNIAPLATVTVSSADTARGQTGEGVADGQPDAREWASAREGAVYRPGSATLGAFVYCAVPRAGRDHIVPVRDPPHAGAPGTQALVRARLPAAGVHGRYPDRRAPPGRG